MPLGQSRRHRASRGRAQAGGSTKSRFALSCSASALESSAVLSNSSSAFRRDAGGPRSRNSRGRPQDQHVSHARGAG
eukprot:730089-Pyramimonas_sp.AAC.1